MKKLLLTVCFSLLLAVPTLSFAQGASKESVRQFLIVTNAAEMGMGPINNQLNELRKKGISDTVIAKINKEVTKDGFVEVLTPVYQKYFTEQEIQEFIKFYQTPTGKKQINQPVTHFDSEEYFTKEEMKEIIKFNQTPASRKLVSKQMMIRKDAREAGQKWGKDVMLKIQKIIAP